MTKPLEMRRTLQQIPFSFNGAGEVEDQGVSSMIVDWLIPLDALSAPAWWSRGRDRWLRSFARDNGPLKTAINTFVNKAISIPPTIEPKDRSISRHVAVASSFTEELNTISGLASTGPFKGFKTFFKAYLFDLVTQDNGAFAMIIGGGKRTGPIVGRPSGLMMLDSACCTRTSNPEYPVVYMDRNQNKYKMHYTRIIEQTNLPSGELEMNGVGLCPVSLCLEAARELFDIYRYSQEKFGSRPPRQILYAEIGATVDALMGAINHWEQKITNSGRSHFGGTLVIAPKMPTQDLKLRLLDMNSAPDGFDRQEVVMQDKAEIAASFGLDLLDLAMSFGLQGQTRANAGIQDKKGRGKGVGEVLDTFAALMDERYLPPYLHLRFDNLDDDQDQQRSEIRDTRSMARERDLRSGVTTIRSERERMWEEGEISKEQFEDMELGDGRLPNGLDVLLLFESTDSHFVEWLELGVADPTKLDSNDAQEMVDTIHEQQLEVAAVINETTAPTLARKARQALAALEKLRIMYEGVLEMEEMERIQAEEGTLEAGAEQEALDQGTRQPAETEVENI